MLHNGAILTNCIAEDAERKNNEFLIPALWTFRRAERAGLGRIWDLPLPHYLTIADMFRDEARR